MDIPSPDARSGCCAVAVTVLPEVRVMKIVDSIVQHLSESDVVELITAGGVRAPRLVFAPQAKTWGVWAGGAKTADRRFHGVLTDALASLDVAVTYALGVDCATGELLIAPYVEREQPAPRERD